MSIAKPASGLRVVFDTNVYFSAFTHPRGVPFRIWQEAIRRRFVLLTSPAIVRELADVLREKLDWDESALVAQLKLIVSVAALVVPQVKLNVVLADDDDNRILECAVAGKADLVVSGDHHLLDLKAFQGIGIGRPVDLLRTLGEPPSSRP
jgi:putative PIN family toxin of toxin-antitoxin system